MAYVFCLYLGPGGGGGQSSKGDFAFPTCMLFTNPKAPKGMSRQSMWKWATEKSGETHS